MELRLVQSLFHSGKFSTRSKGLIQIEAKGALRINPVDAARLTLVDGDRVRLSNQRGALMTTVKLRERVPQGALWFPDHFAQEAANLFECAIDPHTKVPSIRVTAVSMVKIT